MAWRPAYAAGQGRGTAASGKPAAPAGQVQGTIVAGPPSALGVFLGQDLTQGTGTCSVQAGRDLELGIPVTNLSGGTVLLESVKPVPPLSGTLKVLSWHWDPCGSDNHGAAPDTVVLGPGATTWVTAVVESLIACPGPAPLQFQVTYSASTRKTTLKLPGFPDLSAVHYSGCPAPAA